MSQDVTQEYARLLTDVLEEGSENLKNAKGARGLEEAPLFHTAPGLCTAATPTLDASAGAASLGLPPCDDPDTESDFGDDGDTSAADALADLSEEEEENEGDTKDDVCPVLRCKEGLCTLPRAADAVLDRICWLLRPASYARTQSDTAALAARLAAAVEVLARCCALPADLKLELLRCSARRRCTTDAMLRCFLTAETSTAALWRLAAEATHGAIASKMWGNKSEEEDGGCRASVAAERLGALSLRGCAGVTDAGLRTVARCCRALRTLDLAECRNVTADGLQALVRATPALSSLALGGCPALADRTVPVVFRYHYPPHIRVLSVRRCALHDAGLAALASYCPTLQELDVRGCGLLTAAGFDALAQRVPALRVLAAGRCLGLDDRALAHVARGYGASLAEANLAACWRVTSTGVAALAHHCQRLRSLDLRACPRVDDAALEALAASEPVQRSLVRLNLDGCDVGDDALEELVACCPALAFVSVVGCPRVTYQRALRLAYLAHVQIVM